MHNTGPVIRVDPLNPETKAIETAGKILGNRGIVIFPAACMYGVAACSLDDRAVEKVYQLKQRPKNKPVLILVHSPADLPSLVRSVPGPAEKLMRTFWPGKLTLVFNAKKSISPLLTAGTGKIGIRQPAHPVARALCNTVDFPVTGTSANLSGSPSCITIPRLPGPVAAGADLILDAGRLKGGTGSSIVDVTTTPVTIIRQGRVSAARIFDALKN